MNGVGDEWKSSERKLDAKWNTIFARGCKAAGFNVLSATKYGWHEVTQIRWMAFQNGRTRAGVMPPRTDRPLDIAPLHSIPPPPPSPFALFHAFSRSFFFLSRFPFLSSPFLSNVFSSLSLSVTQVRMVAGQFWMAENETGSNGCNSRDAVNAALRRKSRPFFHGNARVNV